MNIKDDKRDVRTIREESGSILDEPTPYLTKSRLAAKMNVSYRTLDNWRDKHILESATGFQGQKVGGEWRFTPITPANYVNPLAPVREADAPTASTPRQPVGRAGDQRPRATTKPLFASVSLTPMVHSRVDARGKLRDSDLAGLHVSEVAKHAHVLVHHTHVAPTPKSKREEAVNEQDQQQESTPSRLLKTALAAKNDAESKRRGGSYASLSGDVDAVSDEQAK